MRAARAPVGAPIYYPWRLFQWWYAFEPYAPGVFNKAGGFAAIGNLLVVHDCHHR